MREAVRDERGAFEGKRGEAHRERDDEAAPDDEGERVDAAEAFRGEVGVAPRGRAEKHADETGERDVAAGVNADDDKAHAGEEGAGDLHGENPFFQDEGGEGEGDEDLELERE